MLMFRVFWEAKGNIQLFTFNKGKKVLTYWHSGMPKGVTLTIRQEKVLIHLINQPALLLPIFTLQDLLIYYYLFL